MAFLVYERNKKSAIIEKKITKKSNILHTKDKKVAFLG